MNVLYTRSQLESKKLADLKAIAASRGITPDGNKACKQTWIDAIEKLQSNAIWRNAYAKTEEVEIVATCSEPALLVEMNGNDCIVDGAIAATITYDDDLTQPWVVKVSGVEVHRRNTWALAYDYVRTHVKYGSLPVATQPEIEQPVTLPAVGDSHFVGDRLLRCIEVSTESAAIWDVIDAGVPMSEVSMDWNCYWSHTLSFQSFATPQEAVASLCESAAELVEVPEFEIYPNGQDLFTVASRRSGKHYQVSLASSSCTCPHWNHRHGREGFEDKHINAVKIFYKATQGSSLVTS
jgi:hypothetical protein